MTSPAQDREESLHARRMGDQPLGIEHRPASDWKRRLLLTEPGSAEERAVLAERTPTFPLP